MGQIVRRLSLSVVLITIASAILLWSDAPRRAPISLRSENSSDSPQQTRVYKVAMMQMVSQPIIDEGAAGVVDSLNEEGLVEGKNLHLSRFNAEGDLATANTMAGELTSGGYDLIITLTTSALQVVGNANKQRKVPHVFGLVTDPTKAGVGIGTEPLDHPPYMVGIGTLQPVADSLQMAQRLNPKLKRVGLAWNPAEVNSEVCTKLARAACRDLKLELVEATVENTAAVNESIASLVSRDVDVLWVGGDVTVLGAFDLVAKAAKNARIPVCTCMPGNALKGALFDLGANYYEVGREIGRLASQVLGGAEISKLPVTMSIPPKLFLNKLALAGLRDDWAFPPEVFSRADATIDELGQHQKPRPAPDQKRDAVTPNESSRAGAATASPGNPSPGQPLDRTWQLRLIAYVNSPDVDEAEHGLRSGLKSAGLVERRDYELKMANAQGDMTALHGMVDSALADHADLILTISTPALQSAVQRARGVPVVFTMVADPFSAGIAKSEDDHLPNVTGAYGANDCKSMMGLVKQVMPNARKMGALFAPTEVNSVYSHKLLTNAARESNYELVSLGVNSPSEAPDVAQSLCSQQIDLICLPNSNLASSSFPTIVQPAKRAKIPVFGFMGSMSAQGAVVILTRDYADMGHDSGQIAARVMRGAKPAEIPLLQSRKTRLFINREAARATGLLIPENLIKSADRVFE